MVFATLAFSGGSLFKKVTVPFDTLVIDEAAQALEPSCLVPLAVSIKQVLAPPSLPYRVLLVSTILMASANMLTHIWASAMLRSVVQFVRGTCNLLSSTLGVIGASSGFGARLGEKEGHGSLGMHVGAGVHGG